MSTNTLKPGGGRTPNRTMLRRKAHLKAQGHAVEANVQVPTPGWQGQGSAFFGVAGVQPDGTLHEIGGEGRTWASEADYHRERGWRAGTLVFYFPADFDKAADDAGETV